MRRWVLLVALVVGLTFALSSAIVMAKQKDTSVNVEKLAKQAASSADANAQAEPQAALNGTHFADVAFNGTLTKGDPAVVSSQLLATGAYAVTFNGNVRNCGWVATPADTKSGDVAAFSLLAVVPAGLLGGNNNQVFVVASQPKGSGAINTGFSLLVNC